MNKRNGPIEWEIYYIDIIGLGIFKRRNGNFFFFFFCRIFCYFNRLKGPNILSVNNTGIKFQIIDSVIIFLNNHNCFISQKRNISNFNPYVLFEFSAGATPASLNLLVQFQFLEHVILIE